MDVAALTVATVSIVLAAAALTWQVLTFLFTGARVKAELQVGAMGSSGVAIGPPSTAMTPQALAEQDFDTPVLAVRVRNIGRMSVNVERVAIRLEPSKLEFRIDWGPNPTMPYRLEPQSSALWYFQFQQVLALGRTAVSSGVSQVPNVAHGRAHLGSGKRVDTPERITLPT